MINEKVKINSRKRKKPKVDKNHATENEQDINRNDNNRIENNSNVTSLLAE